MASNYTPMGSETVEQDEGSDDVSDAPVSGETVPVSNVLTAAVLCFHGLLPGLDKYRTKIIVVAFATVFLQMSLCSSIYWEIMNNSMPIPEECPSFATGFAMNLGLIVLLLYVWGSEFGEVLVSIDIISIAGLEDNYTLTGILNSFRLINAILTLFCTFYIIRASDNPVDVIKDCLAICLIVDLPSFSFAAMQKGLFGRRLGLASKDCDTSETLPETSTSVGCELIARKGLAVVSFWCWILLLLSQFYCEQWCASSVLTTLDKWVVGMPSLGPASCTNTTHS